MTTRKVNKVSFLVISDSRRQFSYYVYRRGVQNLGKEGAMLAWLNESEYAFERAFDELCYRYDEPDDLQAAL